MRFQFYVKVYYHKLFTSSNLLFQLEERVSRKRHFTAVMGQVGSQKSNGTVYRILRKQILQSESLVRIRTSRSLPKEGDPSWVEGFVHSTRCLFISRPEERCSADCPYFGLARLVPRRKLVSFFMFFFCFVFVFWWNENSRYIGLKPGGPDPFQVSAVTTRGQCLYSSRDCNFFFLWHIWHSKSRVFRKTIVGPY